MKRVPVVLVFAVSFLVAGVARPTEPSRKERLAALPQEERTWLTEFVAPIIQPEEEALFLRLTEPHQREVFKKAFWARREKPALEAPMGLGYKDRYEELRRLADDKYDGWRNDAGRMVLRWGEPTSIKEVKECAGETLRGPLEIWTYSGRGAGRRSDVYLFYRPYGAQARKLWRMGVNNDEVFLPNSCRKSFEEFARDCHASGADRCMACDSFCEVSQIYEQIKLRQGNASGGFVESGQVLAPPKVETEDLGQVEAQFAGLPNPNAKPIDVANAGYVSAAMAQTAPVPAQAPPAPAAPAKPLSKKERLAALPEEERKWLIGYVEPIIRPEEEKLFLELTQPHEREMFKEEFWQRRERVGLAAPLGPGYRQRYEHLREVAATQYEGLMSDAGRMIVRLGEPTAIDRVETCRGVLREVEVWSYRSSIGKASQHVFYRPSFGAPRKLWSPGLGDAVLFEPGTCLTTVSELCASLDTPSHSADSLCQQPGVLVKQCGPAGCQFARIAEQIRSAGNTIAELGLLSTPPKVSTEGLETFRQRLANLPNSSAKPIQVASTAPAAAVAAPASPPAAPSPPAKEPSKKERLAALPEEERKWLTDFVAPIIQPEEEALFLQLTEPHERETFKEAFWARREKDSLPLPFGPGYRRRYEELREVIESKYDGWRSDAGRMVLRWGEPASIEEVKDCAPTAEFRNLEIWTYVNRTGNNAITEHWFFYRKMDLAPRELWTVGTRDSDIFEPNSCRKSFPELNLDCNPPLGDRCMGPCPTNCDVYKVWTEVSTRQGSASGGQVEISRLLAPPTVSTEDLAQVSNKFAALPTKGAKSLSVEGPSYTAPAASAAPAKPAGQAASSTPAPAHRKLSKKEFRELVAALPPKYRDFLQLVDLIITDEEREVFVQITDNYQKDRFIESFWRRRSIDSQGLRTDYQAIHTHRVEMALEQFKNLNNDRAKVLIINGPPDAVIPIDCQEVFVPIQIWYYDRLESLKSKVYLIFYQPYGVGPDYKLWIPIDGELVLQVGGGIGGSMGVRQPGGRRVDYDRCPETRTLRQAISYSATVLGSGASGLAGSATLFQPPIIETEGVDQILTMTTELATGSVPLGLAKLVRFPEMRANKIGVDLSLLVAKTDLKPRDLGEEKFYNLDVIGEVVKGERLIDNFKYRFDIPTQEVGGDKIPLTVRRYLYPGEYNLVLKVSDGNQSAEGRITDKLTVPEQPDAPPPDVAAKRADASSTIEKARDLGLLPSAIMLLPVAKEIVTGLQRFETKASDNVKAVDFFLNGSKVMTKTRPPFDADLNLGPLPRKHTIRVVAYGSAGKAVGEDEYTVNEGREIFRVRILSPEKGAKASGPTRVVAAVVVPEGKTLQKMEFYSNEKRVATLYQPPFEQTVNIAEAKSLGYVRVVGTLEDGAVSEDLRYVNAPAYISEVSVDAVELFTTVTDKGRPVQGLQASNFKVFEDGAIQKIESFEYVKNLPLTLGVLIDTSASMLESLPDAQAAALSFLEYSLGAKDRAFTVSFDNEPYLLTKLTNRKDRVVRSLAGLRAEGSTALYDAIIYGLYQFTGIKGKKALVILSDGKDTASKFDYETLVEYVKKAGISIYGIGLKISGADLEVKYKLNKIAQATGGQTFYVDSAKNLDAVYRQINDDLRSQYMLTYYSTNTTAKDKWRKVEVKVEPTSLQARTISGYYP
jgi:Ca-activated chloride channel homolog